VKNWFQSLPFKCILHRYMEGKINQGEVLSMYFGDDHTDEVGLWLFAHSVPGIHVAFRSP
jgi:hypothetical protein